MNGRQAVLVRAVNAMVRAMGGAAITLRIPMASPGTSRELGLETALVQEVELSPVVVRHRKQTGKSQDVEAVISSSVVESALATYGQTDATAFLRSAEQMTFAGEVFVVTGVKAERFAGVEYLYRLSATGIGY
jgi:hypothetical protein